MVITYLNDIPSKINIVNEDIECSARSPDLTSMDFFCGVSQEKTYAIQRTSAADNKE